MLFDTVHAELTTMATLGSVHENGSHCATNVGAHASIALSRIEPVNPLFVCRTATTPGVEFGKAFAPPKRSRQPEKV
jgi:hypothetical protein